MKFPTACLALTFALIVSAHAEAPVVTPPDTDPMPATQSRHYGPYTNKELRGDLDLSASAAAFGKLNGEMRLEFAGTMPETRDFDTSSAAVYRVGNADEYFQANKAKPGACPQPARWFVVRPFGAIAIRITLLTVADWKTFKPDGVGRCGAATYQLPGPKNEPATKTLPKAGG